MKIKTLAIYLLYVCVLMFVCYACSPTKHISKDGYLLSKNKIILNSNNSNISKSSIRPLIKQDPNNKFLGVKIGMYIYSISRNVADSNCNFFEKYLFRAVGDRPVELSEDISHLSCKNIKTYLNSHGCFSVSVKDSISRLRRPYLPWTFYKRRVVENYIINIPNRAIIDSFIITVKDTSLQKTISQLTKNLPIKKGDYYNEDILSNIRNDIASNLRDNGYYSFTNKYIFFEVDTSKGIEKTNINMVIDNPTITIGDSVVASRFKPYKINKIYIDPNYIPITSSDYLPAIDTMLYYHKQKHNLAVTPLYFIHNTTKPIIKEKPIMRCILVQKDNIFSSKIAKNTYDALFQLRNFKYIDISYTELPPWDKDTLDLACFVRLSMNKPINLSSSFEFNYSASNNGVNEANSSNFGVEGNLSFENKNIFHGAEIFTTNVKLASEISSNIFKKDNTKNGWDIFNAFEAGIDFSLELPRFLAPFSTKFYSMEFHPHTSIKAGYNIQKRSYYDRSIFNLNYGYSWQKTEKKVYYFTPAEINYVKINITDQNYSDLINRMDKRIQYQMSNHLVMAMRYSYIFNGQNIKTKTDFNYFSFNSEIAGNVLDAYSNLFNQSKNTDGNYTLFNIPFSQYARTDLNYIHYNYKGQNSTLVYRVFGGIGVAYGNAQALPYEKSFFGGGANNLRAWQMRGLGPGHSKVASNMKYDRAGDIAFGANIEYRFPIAGFLEGATFLDFGNIWTLKNEKGLEGGQFKFDSFYKEIATGAGFGLRINAKFIIIRFDFAAKVWDPAQDLEDRFVLNNTSLSDIMIQFGIGYPF